MRPIVSASAMVCLRIISKFTASMANAFENFVFIPGRLRRGIRRRTCRMRGRRCAGYGTPGLNQQVNRKRTNPDTGVAVG